MAKHSSEHPLTLQARSDRFLEARLRESDLRYLEYLETLSPRDREILAFPVRRY